MLGFLIWVAGPMLFSAWLSLTEWDLLRPPKFVGLSNYVTVLTSSLWWTDIFNTVFLMVTTVAIELVTLADTADETPVHRADVREQVPSA